MERSIAARWLGAGAAAASRRASQAAGARTGARAASSAARPRSSRRAAP